MCLPGEEEALADSDRQPCLLGHSPHWDLQLFRQAQAAASVATVSNVAIIYYKVSKIRLDGSHIISENGHCTDEDQKSETIVCS